MSLAFFDDNKLKHNFCTSKPISRKRAHCSGVGLAFWCSTALSHNSAMDACWLAFAINSGAMNPSSWFSHGSITDGSDLAYWLTKAQKR